MSWIDRVKKAAYTSPSGTRYEFDFEDVSLEFDKKTTAFNFADSNSTYVQQNGNTSRRYPLRCIFWGTNYDLESDKFLKALEEDGIGKLQHPIYGNIDVVPFGSIKRRDDLKTSGNQAIFEIVFFNTTDILYPASQNNTANVVINSIEEYNLVTANDFVNKIDLSTETKKSIFKNTFETLTKSTANGLSDIAKSSKDVKIEFETISQSILTSIDVLVDDPVTLISQSNQLIQLPSKSSIDFSSKLNSYQTLISNLLGITPKNNNDYQSMNYNSNTYLTGIANSAINNEFSTKRNALETAELMLITLEEITNWSDNSAQELEVIQTGESYQQLQEVIALTAGYLVELSFSLKQEKSIVIDRNRTIVDLAAELYGRIDEELDFLINSNNLSGNEILELPKGKEIFYYV